MERKLKEFEEKSTKENKVIVHALGRWDFPHAHCSPAVAKIMLFFEYTKIPYIMDKTIMLHPRTQKMPWITYKNNHKPDSNLIIEWISKQSDHDLFNNIDIDSHLNKK